MALIAFEELLLLRIKVCLVSMIGCVDIGAHAIVGKVALFETFVALLKKSHNTFLALVKNKMVVEEMGGDQLAAPRTLHLHAVLNHLVDVFNREY
jgi:hypothetical protein